MQKTMETVKALFAPRDMCQGTPWKRIAEFAFPMLIGNFAQQLYNTVDAIIVGKFVGTQALAAVGDSASLVINLVVGFFVGLASGIMVAISQYFGAREYDKLQKTVNTAIAFCVIAGAVLTVVGILTAPWVLEFVKNPADTMEDSITYLRIYYVGLIPLLIFNVGSGILRAMGDSRRPFYYLIVCCVLNIILDIVFVLVFKMGVAGVGWATVISLVFSAVLVMMNLCSANAEYRVDLKRIRIDREALSRGLYLGIPAGIQSAMFSLSNLLVQAAVNGFGSQAVAAWSATGKFDGVYWSISNSFGIAISAFVAQAFGAGKYDRMKKSVKVCMGMALGTSVVLSVILLLIAPYGMRLFTDDQAVIDYALEMLMYFVPFYFIWSFIEVLSNSLRGAGDVMRPMVIIMGRITSPAPRRELDSTSMKDQMK